MTLRFSNQRRARGFSIVEAMVALIVMSVGMLGIAGLYVSSLKAGRTAILRTQAVNFASDIADRIRANRTGKNAYDTTLYAPCTGAPGAGATAAETAARNLAATDVCTWRNAVQASLPQANISCAFTAGVPAGMPNNYVVTVTWREPGEAANFTYQLRIQSS
ncbi:MAG TPA: type IV pilus modification protein PilV [Steroidobacteraceae bacterium]|nr:type IV pilus modification protein PilV [Steroidobacteraceae bacterium]